MVEAGGPLPRASAGAPGSNPARAVALGAAAFWPKAIHLESMVYTESLNCLLAAAVMWASLELHERFDDRARWGWAAGVGVFSGLGLLTKVSGVMVILGIAVGVSFGGGTRRDRAKDLSLGSLLGSSQQSSASRYLVGGSRGTSVFTECPSSSRSS
ncbi:MAG: glycosyltransferase family 39 protein [Myxococcales bacterium]|nr:glycosyltransferase family 39 protein [Myxococcales bacterium]